MHIFSVLCGNHDICGWIIAVCIGKLCMLSIVHLNGAREGKRAHRRLNKSEKWNLNWAALWGYSVEWSKGKSVWGAQCESRNISHTTPDWASSFLSSSFFWVSHLLHALRSNLFAVRYKRINTQGQQFIYEREDHKKSVRTTVMPDISVATSKGGHLV